MKTKTCKTCKKRRPVTQFTQLKDERNKWLPTEKKHRKSVCHFCAYDGLTAANRHKIIREAYRNYLSFKQFVAETGQDVIEYAVPIERGSDEFVPVQISFTDLERALKRYSGELNHEGTVLSKRKEQAFHLNVIRDMTQKDVAEKMGISTVSVGQYVDQGMLQLCDYYYAEADYRTLEMSDEQEVNV